MRVPVKKEVWKNLDPTARGEFAHKHHVKIAGLCWGFLKTKGFHFSPFRQEKEAWIKAKYVEKKFLKKMCGLEALVEGGRKSHHWHVKKCRRNNSAIGVPKARHKYRHDGGSVSPANLSAGTSGFHLLESIKMVKRHVVWWGHQGKKGSTRIDAYDQVDSSQLTILNDLVNMSSELCLPWLHGWLKSRTQIVNGSGSMGNHFRPTRIIFAPYRVL